MRLSTAIALALTVLLTVSTVGVIAAAPPTTAQSGFDQAPQLTPAVSAESTLPAPAEPRQVIRIAVSEDGNATWTIESRFVLEDGDDQDAFEAYADELTAGERDTGYDAETFERFAALAEASTDREMHIEEAGWKEPQIEAVDGEAYEYGTVSYSVTWTNFTTVEDGHVYLGDAFETGDGTWFPGLTEEQRLVIERPPNSTFEDVPRGVQDGKLVWDGPYEFDDEEIQVTFRVTADGAGNGVQPPSGGVGDSLLSPVSIVAGIGLLAILLAGGYYLRSRGVLSDLSALGRDDSSQAALEQPSTDGSEAPVSSVQFDDSSVDDPETDAIDVELLSDEERVLRLLRQNGGRMKQARIVKETGWSNAKVSQLLSKMDEDDEIEKLRIGRENLITLPEVDPTEIG